MLIAQLAPAVQLVSTAVAEAAEKEQFDPDKVTPGVGGFLAVAAIAVALFFLGLDLVRRLRRAKYRDEIQRELADELAERDAAAAVEASDTDDDNADAGDSDPRPGS